MIRVIVARDHRDADMATRRLDGPRPLVLITSAPHGLAEARLARLGDVQFAPTEVLFTDASQDGESYEKIRVAITNRTRVSA